MKLSRLWQPRHPAFWMMLALNALSSLLGWIVHTRELALPAALVVALFALGNAGLGLLLAFRLMREEPTKPE